MNNARQAWMDDVDATEKERKAHLDALEEAHKAALEARCALEYWLDIRDMIEVDPVVIRRSSDNHINAVMNAAKHAYQLGYSNWTELLK